MRNLFLIHCVKSVLIWSYSGPYSVQLREIRTRIIPHKYTFHAERKDLANEIVVIWKQATLNTIFLNYKIEILTLNSLVKKTQMNVYQCHYRR